jgi:hypothetical protein
MKKATRMTPVAGELVLVLLVGLAFSPASPAAALDEKPQPPFSSCAKESCIFYVNQGSDDAGTIGPLTIPGYCRGDRINDNQVYFGECSHGEEIVS